MPRSVLCVSILISFLVTAIIFNAEPNEFFLRSFNGLVHAEYDGGGPGGGGDLGEVGDAEHLGAAGEQQLRDEIVGAEAVAPVGGKAAPMPGLAENRVGNAENGGHES